MFCYKCGAFIQENHGFCSGCGTARRVEQPVMQPVEQPSPEQTVILPAEQPVIRQPVLQPAEQPVAQQPVLQPVAQHPVLQPVEQPVAQHPVYYQPAPQPQPYLQQQQQQQQPQQPYYTDSQGTYNYSYSTPPSPPVKKGFRWYVAVPIAAVFAIIVTAVIFFILLSQGNALLRAISNTGQEALYRVENSPFGAFPVLIDTLQNGTLSVSFDYRDRWDNTRGDFSFASDNKNSNYLISGDISNNGQNVDFELYMNKNRVAAGSKSFDNNYYGFYFDTFRSDVRSFASQYGLDREDADEIADIADFLKSSMDRSSSSGFDMDMVKPYTDVIVSALLSAEQTKEKTEIRSSGERYTVTRTDFHITKDIILDALNDSYDVWQNDDYQRGIFDINSDIFGYGYGGNTYDDMLRDFRQGIREFDRDYDESSNIILSFYISSGNRLMRVEFDADISFSGYRERFDFMADFGTSATDTWTFSVNGDEIMRWEYRERTGSFDNVIIIYDGYSKNEIASVWNPGNGSFTITFSDRRDSFDISGVYRKTSDGFNLQIGGLDNFMYGVDRFNLEISAKKGVNIPRIDFINIDKWDRSLVNRLESFMYDFW